MRSLSFCVVEVAAGVGDGWGVAFVVVLILGLADAVAVAAKTVCGVKTRLSNPASNTHPKTKKF